LRDAYPDIEQRGATVIAIGTGDERYAAAFVRDEQIPFTVLVDDDGAAARAASVRTVPFLAMFTPATWKATAETWRRGHRIHKAGKRVTQQGGTWVIGPGDALHYEHVDHDSTDHASVADILSALDAQLHA
jgi:peroxiredoxin